VAAASVSSLNYTASFKGEQPRLLGTNAITLVPARQERGQQVDTAIDELGLLSSMRVLRPKMHGSSQAAIADGARVRPLGSSASTPGLFGGRKYGRHSEPYGGGDWVVPRQPPRPPRPPRRRKPADSTAGAGGSMSSSASVGTLPGSRRTLDFGKIGGARVGERFELPITSCNSLDRPTW
jgi:hypothetical protein